MKICVIGDSHVGAIKRGWDILNEKYNEVDICFYCARGTGLSSLYISGSKVLVSDDPVVTESLIHTSKKDGTIKPKDYDAIFIYSLGLKSQSLITGNFFSKSFLQDFSDNEVLSSLNYRIVGLVSQLTDAPIYIGATPLRASKKCVSNEACNSNSDYISWIKYISRQFNDKMKLIPQPIETITNNRNTIAKFSVGSKKIQLNSKEDLEFTDKNEFHGKRDNKHMNDEYGILYMENILKEILIDNG